jgi:hypothetical protein
MARGKDFVQMPQPSGHIASDVQHENAVLGRHGLVKMVKGERSQAIKSCFRDGLNGGGTRQGFQNAHFTEKISGRKPRQFEFVWSGKVFANSDLSFTDYEEAISGFSLANDHIAGCGFDFFGAVPEKVQGSFVKACENRHVL